MDGDAPGLGQSVSAQLKPLCADGKIKQSQNFSSIIIHPLGNMNSRMKSHDNSSSGQDVLINKMSNSQSLWRKITTMIVKVYPLRTRNL